MEKERIIGGGIKYQKVGWLGWEVLFFQKA